MDERTIKQLFPHASRSLLEANRQVSDTQPEPDAGRALERKLPAQTSCVPSVTVRFIGRRVRPLDPDNFAGSIKDLLDGLRHAALISGDEPWRIKLETTQEKVAHYSEEQTEIMITSEDTDSTSHQRR